MSFCDEKLFKLNERMDQPLPSYSRNQINRRSVVAREGLNSRATGFPESEKEASVIRNRQSIDQGSEVRPRPSSGEVSEGQAEAVLTIGAQLARRESLGENLTKEGLRDEKDINRMSAKSGSEKEGEEEPQPGPGALDCFFQQPSSKRENVPPSPFLFNKRVKESGSSNSNPSSPLINELPPQKNKITDYFRSSVTRAPVDNLSGVCDFSNANAIIKQDIEVLKERVSFDRWEFIFREKDKEIIKLGKLIKGKEEERKEFGDRVKAVIGPMVLELENLKRLEKKNLVSSEKARLGEFVSVRDGSKFRDVWVDGFELRRLREDLQELVQQRETIEAMRKKLKKRGGKLPSTEEKQTQSNSIPLAIGNNSGAFENLNSLGGFMQRISGYNIPSYLVNAAEVSDSSNTISFLQEKVIEETRERLQSQLLYIAREEAFIKEKIESLERQKEGYIRVAKQLYEEENCRFGKLSLSDPSQHWPMLSGRYQLLGLLGKGGFSEVYKGFDCEAIREVACKVHQLNPSWSENVKSNYIRHSLRESQVHRALTHVNIVTHYDSVEIDSNSFCTVLEYCNGPDLAQFIRRHKMISERDSKAIIKQILSALRFLNENDKKIIHYDLKPQNIMFHNGIVKISDFGLCKIMNEDETRLELTSQGVGTYWYLPPECFTRDAPQISTKVDIWSIGVIFYEMLYGVKPFGNDMCQERILKEGIMLKAHKLEFPAKPAISNDSKDFIRKCLEYHQENRINVFEAWNLIDK